MIGPQKTIQNGKNVPVNEKAGFVPQMTGALQNFYQPRIFILVDKGISNGVLVESGDAGESWTSPEGQVIQGIQVQFMATALIPMERSLDIKQEGQRRWSGWDFLSAPQVKLRPDDCFIHGLIQYRVMKIWDFSLYGFMKYFVFEDYKFSGPLQCITQEDGFGNQVQVLDNEGNWVIE